MVSFDDAPAFSAKGQFIKTEGLRGFAMWEAGGDFNDILLDAIREGSGLVDEDDNDTC
jgi:chitinase